ncbi:hypothetical protein HB364_16220 [Pseudoflavitalea sp. X16]|uniref:RHS repeat-associated core domain-containing protein n=1 Tax=Paraflavitalea devenefica TaxID=2716334 RepID=UPI001424647D|nr:RHS repeat-associated core domain-containing protein [Paraflavitalea devenefica]NII26636.1 hypothetical protein [Paraflavitalea devenefica]
MRKFLSIRWFIATALLFLFWMPAQAGVDPPVIKVLDGSLGQLKQDSLIVVEDAKFFDVNNTNLIRPYLVQNVVSFEFNEGIPVYIQGAFSDTIELQVIYTKADNSTMTEYKTWVLDYNTTGAYKHRNTFVFTGGYRVQVKVMSVRSNVAWDSWKALKVVNQLQAFPQYKFSYTGNAVTQVSDSAWTAGADKDELPVWWQPSIGADEYDLEWAYIDSAALAAKRYGPDPNNPNPALIFDQNATRVSITGTAYRIPIIYDSKGHLFYRVRAVQQQSSGVRYEAMWTAFNTVGHGRFDFNGHERTLNWQATTTFAEEGKRKSVVQYYDGSLRGRQTVTKDNTTQRTIVAESFYDYQGRPVVQVLPAPTLNTLIGYTPNFNRGFNHPEYDKSLFDTLPSPDLYCTLQAAPMDSASGASQYYSGSSAFKDSGVHKYVPRAEGFPFTEVEYTQDNTGRISRQGGVGKDFRLGSGHETRYIYATPDQGELDALFGTEVGDKSHYFKNLVRDANGQYSISYVDMHGRTIATALAGTPDTASKLERLAANNPATRTEVLADPYSAVIKDLVMEHKKSLAVTTAGNHDFNYVLNPLLLKEEGCNMDSVCYDCLYDLRITITDDCNNQKLGGAPFDTLISNFSLEAIDTVCSNGQGFSVSFTKWLSEGNYEITKQLSVSRYGMEYYRDSIFMAANTCKTLDSFIVEQRAIVQAQQSCKPSCQACTDSLGSWSQYWQRFRQANGIDDVDAAVYENMALQSYAEAKQACDELCNKLSDLTGIRKTMLMDMTPSSGQYANIDNEQDRYSIFFSHIDSSDDNRIKDTFPVYSLVSGYLDADGNPDLVFDESAGKLVPPQDLSPEVFAQRFKPSWAEALLHRHPEYCKLQRYEQWQASHEWDRLFEGTDTYAEAKAKGYLNPLGETGTIETLFGPDGGDPLSDTTWFKSKLMDSLLHFRTVAGKRLSLWGLASITVMCPEGSSAGCYTPYLNTGSFPNDQPNSNAFNTTAMCAGELDMAWRSFRQLYLDIKRSLVNKRIKEYCNSSLTAAKIVATGHQPHFSDAAELLALQPAINKPTTKAEGEALQQQYYEDNCKAYAHQWLQDLAPCTLYDEASLNNIIIPALINICKEGSDLKHPYGSSSVKPSSTAPATHRSFEAYLEYYNSTHGISNNQDCNAYLIKAPQPYDQQVVHGNKPLYTKPDTCECSTISRLYGQYKPKQTLYGSFSNYLNRVYQTDIADSTLNTLLSLCGHADFPAADCDFISKAIFLPPVFQCNTGDICVDCSTFATLHAEFKQKFPSVNPAISYSVTTDSTQYKWNRLYEQFMNYRLGFVKTADDYLQFKAQCDGGVSAACDSLQDIVDSFRVNRQQYGVRFEILTEDNVFHRDQYELIQNGSFQLPDTARKPGGSSSVRLFMKAGSFCGSGGYANEVRYRYLGTGGSYYANLGHFGCNIALIKTTSSWGPPGIYLHGFTDEPYNIYQGYIFGGNGFNVVQVSADTNALNPHIIKAQITPAHYRLYFDGNLVIDIPRDSTLPILNIGPSGFGSGGRYMSIDWWKMYDGNEQLRYFEDFSDPDNLSLFDPAAVCPAGTVPDCQSSFVGYFNQRTGNSYTSSQIDSLYTATCGKLPYACASNTAPVYDTLISWLNDYKKYGGIPHLDASGADTTRWRPNFNGYKYGLGVPLAEIIKDGVLSLPDYYTDTLPDDTRYDDIDFDYYDTLCMDPAGFDIEFRVKLPDSLVIPNWIKDKFWFWILADLHPSGSMLGTFKYEGNGAAICTHQNHPAKVCAEEPVPIQSFNDWRIVKFEFRGTRFRMYIDNSLMGERTLDAPFTILEVMAVNPMSQKAKIDFYRIRDINGRLLYNEEFNDPYNLAIPDRSLKCGGCEVDYARYYYRRTGINLTYNEIAGLYAQAGITLDACAKPDLTLCGRTEPAFPPTLLEAIDNCSDSTFIIQSKAQDLYSRYADSVKGRFDSSYRAKCLQAYKYERFTVRHTVSEYHYTLYYYDQAGNLVKTIPPAGVQPNYDSLWLDSVQTARLAGGTKLPAHALPTQYRYNTLNQVTAQKSPDGGKTDFWYDRLGRLALSRNARQLAMSSANNHYFSYTRYDTLGRITEVGQLRDTLNQAITDTFTRNETALTGWHTSLLRNREQVTATIYDIPYDGFTGIDPTLVTAQQNVRNRVSYVTYTDTPGVTSAYNHGSFYSYDIHGNVDTLLQDYGRKDSRPNIMNKNENRWKKLVYEYDLISGKVNKVMYQPRFSDQWTHRYYYDAENRLTEVETSTDGYTWEKEAKYEYYLHGPLARTVIGQQQVQGIDFAYTLQGWLKGMNSTGAMHTHDIGGDGKAGSLNQYVARDALGFNLNYFGGDYKAINPTVTPFPDHIARLKVLADSNYRPLYNGNISSMASTIRLFSNTPYFYNYKYDQLNRLKAQDVFTGFNRSTNSYAALAASTLFRERVYYDANGNITNYLRNAANGNVMDSLTYKYYAASNKLRQVRDSIGAGAFGTSALNLDIDNQPDTSNYVYDEIGNIIQDKAEGITSIKWNVYGKITEINRTASSFNPYTKIVYSYDAQGNRIGKTTNQGTGRQDHTWYVRDAQGNLMSTYTAWTGSMVAPENLQNLALNQTDLMIYGSSRLGVYPIVSSNVDNGPWINPFYNGNTYARGWRQYELSNHLGNVLTTISDRNFGVSSGGSLTLPNGATIPVVDYYDPHMVAANDYYPFGMLSRLAVSSNNVYYKYGFNGKENDYEVKGWQNQQDYGMRIYDPRVGRFLSVDPLTQEYPWYTPYQYAGNKPIKFIDLDGAEEGDNSIEKYWENQPKIDMTKASSATSHNAAGIPRNGIWMVKQQIAQKPEMFSDANLQNVKLGRMPIVDEQWVKHNPNHAGYMKQGLLHHHIDGQEKAVLIPSGLNREKFSDLHAYLKNKVKGMTRGGSIKGMTGGLMSFLGFLGTASMFNTKNPDAWINGFSGGEQPEDYIYKIKKDFQSGVYVEINGVSFEYAPVMKNGKPVLDKNGNPKQYLSKRIVTGTLYSGYIYDEDTKTYRGVDKISTRIETWQYDQNGNRVVKSYDPDKIL